MNREWTRMNANKKERHCERSEAIQGRWEFNGLPRSLWLLAMTICALSW